MINQRTLKNVIQAFGVGVHSGEKVLLTLKPAPINTGIIFTRIDLDEPVTIPATADFVVNTTMSTNIGDKGITVNTIEHLMSALAGLGIDNVHIEISTQSSQKLAEVPVMDGSARIFVFLIQSVGVQQQMALKKFIRIKSSISVKRQDKYAKLTPYDGFKINFGIEYAHPLFNSVPTQASIDLNQTTYIREVSGARTYGFISDYEKLQKMNLARGSSLYNSVVIDESASRVLNETGLRYQNEFVKHKILDAIGDLYLLGHGIIGEFTGFKSGHALNNELVKALLSRPDAWEYISFNKDAIHIPRNCIDFQVAVSEAA